MSGPGTGPNGSMGPGGHSAPQPIPGRYDPGSGNPSPALGSFKDGFHAPHHLVTAGSMPAPDTLARQMPVMPNSLNPAALSPDLLPLLKEIWGREK